MSRDVRKNYIFNLIENHFGDVSDTAKQFGNVAELNSFLDDGNTTVLTVIQNAPKSIVFTNNLNGDSKQQNLLVFYKSRPEPITDDNIRTNIMMSTMSDPVNGFYQSLQRVFGPVLLQNTRNLDPKLQQLLEDLERGLGNHIRKGDASSNSKSARDSDISDILVPMDEVKYWEDLAMTGLRLEIKERAQSFVEILQPLAKLYSNIDSHSLNDGPELIAQTQDALDEIWKQTDVNAYPEPRMVHFLEIIGSELCRFIQRRLATLFKSVWSDSYPNVKDALRQSITMGERWCSTVDILTDHMWKQYPPHPWQSGKLRLPYVENVVARLISISEIRTVNEQLMQLLSPMERERLSVSDQLEDSFKDVSSLYYNAYTEPAYKAAIANYHRDMRPAEDAVANKLRLRLKNTTGQVHQLLREFQQFRELIKRPNISQALTAERETLLGQLMDYIKTLKSDFKSKSKNSSDLPKGKNLPEVVNSIVWIQQQESKVKELMKASSELLGSLPGFEKLKQACEKLQEDMDAYKQDRYQGWCEEMLFSLNDPNDPVSIRSSSRVMELDHRDGKLHVHYSERLVGLLREVRQLAAFGFRVPGKIQTAVSYAQRFYKHAVILKQVAHFYNTIDQQMIPSQRPMMLDSALNFERIIKKPKAASKTTQEGKLHITWDKPEELEEYIKKLQSAAQKLTMENRQYRRQHSIICDKVVALMTIDLLQNQPKWKESLSEMRRSIGDIQQKNNINPSSMKPWKAHWNRQLYKALEHQYQMGLEALNQNLPEFKVDLVFRQEMLQFKPPFEEIRSRFYKEMKKFINIPNIFRGMTETGEDPVTTGQAVFPLMIDRNAEGFSTIYSKAEDLFKRLIKVKEQFTDLVIIGQVRVEELVKKHCNTYEEYEKNFRMVKLKGKEVEKLPTSFKVDCISVSATPVKTSIDDQLQRLFDALLDGLRETVTLTVKEIEAFVNDASESLNKMPQTVEEIGEANEKHTKLRNDLPTMQAKYEKAEKFNTLLRKMCGEGVGQALASLRSKWDTLDVMMESHHEVIQGQIAVMKAGIETKVQVYCTDLEKFSQRWKQLKPGDDIIESGDRSKFTAAIDDIKSRKEEFTDLQNRKEKLIQECQHFDISPPDLSEVDELRVDIEGCEAIWLLYEDFSNGLEEMSKQDWISFRSKSHMLDDFLTSWDDRLRQDPSTMTIKIQEEVATYKELVPALKYVRGEHLSQDHWIDLFQIIGLPRGTTLEKLLFKNILSVAKNIISKVSELKELNSRAQGEVSIREALRDLDKWGASAVFTLTDYQDCEGKSLRIIKDWKEIVNEVGDNQCLLQSLKDSPYFKGFEDRATSWETKLAQLDEFLHKLNSIQRKWVYLEPIFGHGALPQEQSRFGRVDQEFRAIMSDISRDNRVVSLVGRSGMQSQLTTMLDQLQRCQRSLNEYLEEKRDSFPRFYFIGDDDLLEILGQSTKPTVIQSHLKKLFAGIHRVVFDDNQQNIKSMCSLDGEIVDMKSAIRLTTNVEEWLEDLSKGMKDTLHDLLYKCIGILLGNKGNLDPSQFPSQVLCIAEQVRFTERCESALSNRELPNFKNELNKQLQSYTSVFVSSQDQDDDSQVLKLKLKALILDIIHCIDVVSQLIEGNISSTSEWMWQKQLRYYIKSKAGIMRMVDAEFAYTYEYQGNAPKLVHTPLTDKCYLTLTQGMRLGLGGNPYGPAGTGKTESVKALGGLFGRQVLVFNCDEGIDVKSMGRIFVGLVKCGAWGCFDEFNRLEEAVLSAVSMDIQVIQAALKKKAQVVELLGRKVDIDPNSGIFITMNPAGKGYGGRQKLPDNLKQLFRPVAMSRPDNELIAEVILFSEGFQEAKALGRKLVAVFNLSRELLTSQQHYDWGLRALKTVLRGSGQMLQTLRTENGQGEGGALDIEKESLAVVQALRLNTISKLTFSDSERFDALVKDVFKGVPFVGVSQEQLKDAIKLTCEEMKLSLQERQVKKTLELYEQLKQRMGVVVVGPSGSGKSTLWQILQGASAKLGQVIKLHTVNPKAMPRTQLLGQIDIDTREWSDGVLTNSAREVIREDSDVHSWIICDGDIDPEWIESLNSVLDDNRLLTMPSGERIQFGPNINFLFETHDLSSASPATISRMGMIFLSDEDADVKALVHTWMQKQPEHLHIKLESWFEDFFYRALDWVRRSNDMVVESSLVGSVLNGLSHLHGVKTKTGFLVALLKGLGGNLSTSAREDFAKEIFQWGHENLPDQRHPLNAYYNEDLDTLDCFKVDLSQAESFASDIQNMEELPVVKTVEMQRNIDYVLPWLQSGNRQPFMVVGPDGCGKSMLLKECFSRIRSTQVAMIHCNAQTSPVHLVQKLQQACMTISGGASGGRTLRPRDCENLVLYLKDINLPKPDKWGTSQLIAFLQQILTYHGFYDETNEWVGLDGIQIVASMNAASTLGRHKLTSRFTSRVRIISVDYPGSDELSLIYGAYLGPILHHDAVLRQHPVWGSRAKIQQLASSMIRIYEEVRSNFLADDHGHYVFTPRDLSQWCTSLLRYDDNSVSGSDSRSADALLRVWAYEGARLFRDRIVDTRGRHRFDSIISGILMNDWSSNVYENMNKSYYVTWGARQESHSDKFLPKHGKQLGNLAVSDLKDIISKGIATYKRDVREIDILVFEEVLEYMARVDRILTRPGGSFLLAGRTGVGRRTAISVVANMHQMTVFTPKVTRIYGMKQFKADIKSLMQLAAIEGEQVVLILEDFQLVDPAFLELINSLLSAGEVPGLYASEELDPLLSPLRDEASQDGHRGPMYNYFAKRVMSNLHIALIMDVDCESFAINCESNPALYKKCTVQWMEGWGKTSMEQLPEMLLSHELPADSKLNKSLVQNFVKIHNSTKRQNQYSTPRRYMTFLRTYQSVYLEKKRSLQKKQSHLQAGLSKLNEAASHVDSLKQKAADQSRLLAEKQNEADTALRDITVKMDNASGQKSEMEVLKQKAAEERMNIDKRKKAIDIELREVQPLIESAKKAVGNINPTTLAEIRALRMPPDTIRDILEGVLRLMGIFDTSWVSMKSFLAKRGVKEDIMSFDARRITPEIRESVDELLDRNKASFETKNAKRASTAALPLAEWVKANIKFSKVLERIEPLEKEQEKLQKSLEKAESRTRKLAEKLKVVNQEVQELKDRFERGTMEAAKLKVDLDEANKTITAAETLVSKLSGERDRWNIQVKALSFELETLPARVQLAAAFINYLAAAPEDVRRERLADWQEITGMQGFDVRRFMSTESQQLEWKSEGLPSDNLSLENALVILHGKLQPFLIDPSSRATEWLKIHLKDTRLEVINQQDANFANALELAVRFGKTLIIQEMDQVEPILYPLLRKDLVSMGPRYVVQLGEKTVDYNEDFRLFMTTRNPLPDIAPDAASIISAINFTTTRAGLTSQLLTLTLQHEKPELEHKKTKLLANEERLKIELSKLEESLLEQLAEAQGNILENKTLLDSLNQTKSSSNTITESLKDSQEMEVSLDQERNAFLPVAEAGSKMFFVIIDLSKINNMYRFSLSSFLRLFEKTLELKSDFENTEARIKSLSNRLQSLVYESISQSLFKADRLMFALHLVRGTKPGLFKDKEWEHFLGLLVSGREMNGENKKKVQGEIPIWIDQERHRAVSQLKANFPSLYQTMNLQDSGLWMTFSRSSKCEQEIPTSVATKTSNFQHLLMVQALRSDRLQSAMSLFASQALGVRELSSPGGSLKQIYDDTLPTEPVLIVISPGADPSQELQELAAATIGAENYFQVAMGQGQADIAKQLLKEAARSGHWLCLKNLHLVTSWLPLLEKELNSLKPHDNFRLWLTSEVHPKFPTILLQSSFKVTYESPPGIKKNLLRTYDSWSSDFVNGTSGKSSIVRSQALFALAWLHAVVQERRNFIPQGWTKFYEFSLGDLRVAADAVDRLCSGQKVHWDFMHGLMENAIYGGRVDNNFDMRVLSSYLRKYFDSGLLSGGQSRRKLVGNVSLPSSTNIRDYIETIESLPDDDQPNNFGLPANIERSAQTVVSQRVISQLKIMMRSVEVGGKFDREAWSNELSPVLGMWKKLNQGTSPNLVHQKVEAPSGAKNDSPVLAFILLERYNAIQLVQTVHQSLSALSKVIRGSQLLSTDVQKMANSLLLQETPLKWQAGWEGPDDPMQYMHTIIAKAMAIQGWVSKAERGTILKEDLDLADLFHPNTFLNALRQQAARDSKTSMDELKFVCSWKGSLTGAKNPVRIGGLQLEGCTFDGNRLSENQRDSPTVSSIPPCHVAWIPKQSPAPYPESDVISLPVYTSSTRESIVTCLDVPCGGNTTTWVQSGAALFLKQR
ncbi:cytoplasmic dynein 2 heavy chain 1-like [Styela clava]